MLFKQADIFYLFVVIVTFMYGEFEKKNYKVNFNQYTVIAYKSNVL